MLTLIPAEYVIGAAVPVVVVMGLLVWALQLWHARALHLEELLSRAAKRRAEDNRL